ncbi:MAG: serine hydrolase [Acidobacteriota bacterium]
MKVKIILSFVFAILMLTSCKIRAQMPKVLTEPARFKLAADYSREHRGISVLVMKGDKIVFEDYENSATADTPWLLFSGTKSFSGAMLCAAIQDRLISGFDEKVSDTITEWKSDRQKSQITIRQLLSLTSGVNAGQIGVVPSYKDAINSPTRFVPGRNFEYGPVPYQAFGELMTRKLKAKNETVMAYMKRRILDPLSIRVSDWRVQNGQPLLPQGASLTAREWVKFGLFMKNGGKWNGKQLIPKKLLDELIIGSKANPAYGITFWLNHPGKNPIGKEIGGASEIGGGGFADGLSDLFLAAGANNQRLYIIRSLDMVIVRQGRMDNWSDREFLGRLLAGKLGSNRS